MKDTVNGESESVEKKEGETNEEPLIGTSAKLFGDVAQDIKSRAKQETAADEPKAPMEQEAPEVMEALDDLLDITKLSDKKVKTKIDGVESVVPISELLKNYQTWESITRKGQQVAEERKKLEELRTKEVPEESKEAKVTRPEVYDEELKAALDPLYDKIDEQSEFINSLLGQLDLLKGDTQDLRRQKALKSIDKQMKAEQIGDDFMEKVDDIEELMKSLYVTDPDRFNSLNTTDGYISLYKDLKIRELQKSVGKPKTKGKDVKVVPIESSSSSTNTDDSAEKYQTEFKRAQETGDWGAVLKLKGVI